MFLLLNPRFSDFLRTCRQRWETWVLAGLSHPDPEIAEHLARWSC